MGSVQSGYSQKKRKWQQRPEHLDLQMQRLSTELEREEMKGDQKKDQNVISVIRQPRNWMDCSRQLFQRLVFKLQFTFFRGQRKHGQGVPYCRFERQMVTEKRSQIQSVSKRNPNELDETSPFSINPRLKLQVQNSNSDIKS